jgi:hypothetical protein
VDALQMAAWEKEARRWCGASFGPGSALHLAPFLREAQGGRLVRPIPPVVERYSGAPNYPP